MLSLLWSLHSLVFLLAVKVHSYAITGIASGVQYTGERPFRTEINQFAASGAAFDLYILALQKIQQYNESDITSYFQVSGIHGYPTIQWDGAPGSASWGWGYCTHDSVLFPAWHRPFVALFEQVLWDNAQSIAATYPSSQRDEYVNAAATFRIPYWDWALNSALPSVATSPTISVNTPSGAQTINNPLFSYTFHTRPVGNGFPNSDPAGVPAFSKYMSTVRWPDSNGNSQNSMATNVLQQEASFLLSSVYQILTSSPNYTTMSTSANSLNSIEYIHDAVHYFVGGSNGHMDWLQWAGFDPMFWLHHANVDRILAIWQAIYPDSYVEPAVSGGNFGTAPGTAISSQSPLMPFHYNDNGDFYTADSVRWTRWFGYTYPEVLDWTVNATVLASNVREKVNQLYNPNAGSSSSKKVKRWLSPVNRRKNTRVANFQRVNINDYHTLDINNLEKQWTANLQVDKHALNSSFNIDLFLGDPPSNKADWPLASNLLGTFAILSSAGLRPESQASGKDISKYGQIPLTPNLATAVSQGIISNLQQSSVIPLLKTHLQAHVQAASDAISLGDLSGFSISISSRDVTPPASITEFPTYGLWVDYPMITKHINNINS